MSKREIGYLFVLLGITVFLRLVFLFQPMRYDEAFSFLVFSSKPLSLGLSYYPFPNNHLFFTLLSRICILVFGNAAYIIRLPAFFAGIITVPVNYFLIRRLANKEIAFFATAFLATSSILIEYSTNARGYSLIILFFLLSMYFLDVVFVLNKLKNWMFFIVFSALGLYTSPVMIYALAVSLSYFLFLLLTESKDKIEVQSLTKRLIISCCIVFGLVFLLYLPVIIKSGITSIVANRFVRPTEFKAFISGAPYFLNTVLQQWMRGLPQIFLFAILFAVILDVLFSRSWRKISASIFISSFFGVGSMLLITRRLPPVRAMLFLVPYFYFIIAAVFFYAWRVFKIKIKLTLQRQVFYIAVILAALIHSVGILNSQSIYNSEETGALRSAREITLFLKDRLDVNSKVISFCPSDAILAYYFDFYKIRDDYLYGEAVENSKIYIVLKKGQSFKEMLAKYSLPAVLRNAEKIFDFEDAELYLYVNKLH